MGIDELKDKLGTEFWSVEYDVEKGMIRRFVQAVGDPSPQWQKVAPPTLILTIGLDQIQQELLDLFPSATILHGSTELECYRPIMAGETLTATASLANIRERQGKMGKMAFVTVDTTYKNRRQETVARCRQMVISY